MALYAVGDLQGCLDSLQRLLAEAGFNPGRDTLWLVGDLVNRGPKSRETLDYVRGLGSAARTVLGNHDLHLLASAAGSRPLKAADTLAPILNAADSAELLDWLRHQPILIRDVDLDLTLTHAGILPQWDLNTALACAAELEWALKAPGWKRWMPALYGDRPDAWAADLKGSERLRLIVNAFTRMRYVDATGRLDLRSKNSPHEPLPEGVYPWFECPSRLAIPGRIVFGHWSTLGLYQAPGLLGLDSGCVWGGFLSLARLDRPEPEILQVPCPEILPPGAD